MNGYAVVYEPARIQQQSFDDASSSEFTFGTAHATKPEVGGVLPGPMTLCGRGTEDMERHPQDQPYDDFDTWYPPVGVPSFCRKCNRIATSA